MAGRYFSSGAVMKTPSPPPYRAVKRLRSGSSPDPSSAASQAEWLRHKSEANAREPGLYPTSVSRAFAVCHTLTALRQGRERVDWALTHAAACGVFLVRESFAQRGGDTYEVFQDYPNVVGQG